MKRPMIFVLAACPMMAAATCPPESPAPPIQDLDPSNNPTLEIRCGVLTLSNGEEITPEQLEARIQGLIDALGLDFGGKTIIVEAFPFTSSDATALSSLDLDALDDASRGRIAINTNHLDLLLSNQDFVHLSIAHELNHLTELFDPTSSLRRALVDLFETRRAFRPFESRPETDRERQQALVAALEADIAYTKALVTEEARVYGNVESDREVLAEADLLSGDGRTAAATIASQGRTQVQSVLPAKLRELERLLVLEKARLEKLGQVLSPTEDQQVALDLERMLVEPVTLAGDGGCGIDSASLSVVRGAMTLLGDEPEDELVVALETTEGGLTDFAPILGQLDVSCEASITYEQVAPASSTCIGSSGECDGEAIVGRDAASLDQLCAERTVATVAAVSLTCFTDDSLSEVLCEERLSPGGGAPDEPPTQEPPTAVSCSPDRAPMSGDVVPQAGVELDPSTSSCSVVSGLPAGDQLVIDDLGGTFGGSGSSMVVLAMEGGSFENLDGFFLLDDLATNQPISIQLQDEAGRVVTTELTIEPGSDGAPAQLVDVSMRVEVG